MLLHVCCGPCATSSIEQLLGDGWEVDMFFSNSNISPKEEYDKRLDGAVRTAEWFGLKLIEDSYDHQDWLKTVAGYESEPEKGARCSFCFGYSLDRTSEAADAGEYDGFCTTLTVSPHKVSRVLFEKGTAAGRGKSSRFVDYDFKKKDGYRRSILLSEKIGLYRQNYCGCEFSMR